MRIYFLQPLEAEKSKIKTDTVSNENTFPGSLEDTFLGCSDDSGVRRLLRKLRP